MNISVVYNDHATKTPLDSIATFSLPFEANNWINIGIQVMNDKVS